LPEAAGDVHLHHYRIDETHSNSYAAWKRMGSPIAPNREQYEELRSAGRLGELGPPSTVAIAGGAASLSFRLPRQAVSLLVFDWGRGRK
jgi:xylan 1,4-beta-xylosidase